MASKGLRKGGRTDYEGVVEYGGETDRYEWNQTEEEVNVSIKLPKEVTKKDIICDIKPDSLKVSIRGQEKPILEGNYPPGKRVISDESGWTISTGSLDIMLWKFERSDDWWPCVIDGEPEIDVELIKGSKYLDRGLLLKLKVIFKGNIFFWNSYFHLQRTETKGRAEKARKVEG